MKDLRESFAAKELSELQLIVTGTLARWAEGNNDTVYLTIVRDGDWCVTMHRFSGSTTRKLAIGIESTLHAALVSMLVDLFEDDDDDRPELVNEWAEEPARA